MKKSAARKPRANELVKPRKLTIKRETLKDLTPQGQPVKGGLTCNCTRTR
jgi:hypothetical protein